MQGDVLKTYHLSCQLDVPEQIVYQEANHNINQREVGEKWGAELIKICNVGGDVDDNDVNGGHGDGGVFHPGTKCSYE